MYKKFLKTLLTFFILSFVFAISINCSGGGSDSNDPADPQASLTIDKESITFDSNSTATITATAEKADGSDDTIFASSSDPTVASVSVTNLVTTVSGIKAGTTTITITSSSGLSKTCTATLISWQSVFEDNFNRSDADDLGSNWTIGNDTNSTVKIYSNTAFYTSTSTIQQYSTVVYNTTLTDSKNRITCFFTTSTDLNIGVIDILSRFDSSDGSGYLLAMKNGTLGIYKAITGTPSLLNTTAAITLQANTTYKFIFELNGSSLKGTLQNTSGTNLAEVTATDATYTSGKVGFEIKWLNPTSIIIDDFKVEK